MHRAYSLLTIKSMDEDTRTIEGIATTPTPDRLGDIVESAGAQFSLPIPLLWQHDSHAPIGTVDAATISKDGISIKATVLKVTEPGRLKDRLDEAWQSIKLGLVRGLSIGFKPIKSEPIKDTWSEHFKVWDWLELSAVTIPANAEASILSVKSADRALLAASGEKQQHVTVRLAPSKPGVTGKAAPKKEITVKPTIAEQIVSFEAKRLASAERMSAIMEDSAEKGISLDEAQTEEYETLKSEVKATDDHLVRLRDHEQLMASKAKAIEPQKIDTPKAGTEARAPAASGIVSVGHRLEKGIKFTRYVKALAMAKGSPIAALAIAEGNKQWMDTSPEVALVLRAAVAGGDTTTSGWASELVYNENLVSEFIELLRPQTIIGRIPGLTRVPFNVRMSGQDSGSTAYWVGQGAPTPVSALNTLEVTLGIAKAAGLVVLTEELVRSSAPSAEMLVRNDLMKAIVEFSDVRFVDPGYAAVANVNPASITNGLTATTPSGTSAAAVRADVQTLFATWINNNLDPSSGVWIMSPTTALAIQLMRTSLDQPEFPGITMNGGTFFGMPVVVSNSANIAGSPDSGRMIILVNAREILLADDGQVTIDASREASIQMLDNPTNDAAAGTPTTMVSMFQTNAVAIRAVRFINWAKRRSTAVVFIQDAAYVA